jgi:hypothetical protein
MAVFPAPSRHAAGVAVRQGAKHQFPRQIDDVFLGRFCGEDLVGLDSFKCLLAGELFFFSYFGLAGWHIYAFAIVSDVLAHFCEPSM